MSTSNAPLALFGVAALLLPIGHAAGGAGGGDHGFWDSFLTPPPLHPILVNFTAALIPISFACDLIGRWRRRESLLSAGWWALLFGAALTPFTAVAGWLWLRDMGDVEHGEMLIHQWLGTALALLLVPLVVWRWKLHRAGARPTAAYLAATGILVAALVVQGHLGGMMSFGAGEAGPRPGEHSQPGDGDGRERPPHEDDGHGHSSHGTTQPEAPDGVQWRPHIEVKD